MDSPSFSPWHAPARAAAGRLSGESGEVRSFPSIPGKSCRVPSYGVRGGWAALFRGTTTAAEREFSARGPGTRVAPPRSADRKPGLRGRPRGSRRLSRSAGRAAADRAAARRVRRSPRPVRAGLRGARAVRARGGPFPRSFRNPGPLQRAQGRGAPGAQEGGIRRREGPELSGRTRADRPRDRDRSGRRTASRSGRRDRTFSGTGRASSVFREAYRLEPKNVLSRKSWPSSQSRKDPGLAVSVLDALSVTYPRYRAHGRGSADGFRASTGRPRSRADAAASRTA